jgi:tetratricopeptide (TPR) repeat protein
MFSILVRGTENTQAIVRGLRGLAQECWDNGLFRAAYAYLEKSLPLPDIPGDRAGCLLAMGQALERAGDYQAALETYAKALELPQEPNDTWYFLNNNLAYCLNKSGLHEEAEKHCRAAIKICPERHNAHKNLGIALQRLGRYAEAVQCYIRATQLAPTDPRAMRHLEDLLAAHEEILEESPGLWAQLNEFFEEAHTDDEDYGVQ